VVRGIDTSLPTARSCTESVRFVGAPLAGNLANLRGVSVPARWRACVQRYGTTSMSAGRDTSLLEFRDVFCISFSDGKL